MVREVISLGVGQAGIQLSGEIWRQYNAEHSISADGTKTLAHAPEEKTSCDDLSFQTFYEETAAGQYVPRSLLVDLESNVLDDLKASEIAGMFHPDFLVHGKEDAANNFARGHYTVGRDMIEQVSESLRRLTDHCDNVMGFLFAHSVAGGTGSGLGALILERLTVDYRRKAKFGFELFPSPNLPTAVVEPYNALLSMRWLIEHTDVSLLLDNEAIYEIVTRKLAIKHPSYDNLNRLISKVISSMTASLRFGGELNVDMSEFQTNLVPFPKLHFMVTSMAPIATEDTFETMPKDARAMTDMCFRDDSFFIKFDDWQPSADKFMAVCLNYRGDVMAKEAVEAVGWLKSCGKAQLVQWCPTGFKIGLNEQPPAVTSADDVVACARNVVMIGNNSAVSRVFNQRISKKFDMLYSQRAFVHWYVGEGMEEGEFAEAREELGLLESDYLDLLEEDETTTDSEEDY